MIGEPWQEVSLIHSHRSIVNSISHTSEKSTMHISLGFLTYLRDMVSFSMVDTGCSILFCSELFCTHSSLGFGLTKTWELFKNRFFLRMQETLYFVLRIKRMSWEGIHPHEVGISQWTQDWESHTYLLYLCLSRTELRCPELPLVSSWNWPKNCVRCHLCLAFPFFTPHWFVLSTCINLYYTPTKVISKPIAGEHNSRYPLVP